MYGNYLDDAAKIVAEKREENLKFEHARLTAEEKDDLLLKFHLLCSILLFSTSCHTKSFARAGEESM